ncbi:MAG: hypothetical protein HYV07_08665 [Deltaproteobacteria bacterium]|nr:hypothetical protein [Deltaproteobacteria bacterium]
MRRLSTALALSTVAASMNAEAAEDGTIVVQERRPFAILLGTPTGEIARTRSSDVIRMLSEQLAVHTNFFAELADANILSKCRGQLGCMVEAVRPDYVYDEAAGLAYDQIQRKLAREGVAYPKYLLVVSNVAIEGQADRLAVVLVDTDLALAAIHDAPHGAPNWREDVEAQISTSAVLYGPERVEVSTPEETSQFLDKLFSTQLWRIFEKSGNWEPYGEISLVGVEAGYAVSLDGNVVGTTASDQTQLREVVSGLRRLRLEHPSIHPLDLEVDVARGKTVSVEVHPIPIGDAGAKLVRGIVTWTGAGVAAIGAAITVAAILAEDSDVKTYCFKGEGSPCESARRFATLGYDPSKADTLDPSVNPAGVMLAPLGYSLIGAGLTWSLGTELLGPKDELPWIPLAVGAAVGALSYVVSGLAQPGDPLAR